MIECFMYTNVFKHAAHRKFEFQLFLNQPKSDCIYLFPTDFEPKGIPFASKSIRK